MASSKHCSRKSPNYMGRSKDEMTMADFMQRIHIRVHGTDADGSTYKTAVLNDRRYNTTSRDKHNQEFEFYGS